MNWVRKNFLVSWKYKLKEDSAFAHILMVFFIMPILILALVIPALCADQESNVIKVYYNDDLIGSNAYIDPASGVGMVPLRPYSIPSEPAPGCT